MGPSGTITHIPPERWEDPSLTPTQHHDAYAYAIMCWQLFTEELPFAGKDDLLLVMSLIIGVNFID